MTVLKSTADAWQRITGCMIREGYGLSENHQWLHLTLRLPLHSVVQLAFHSRQQKSKFLMIQGRKWYKAKKARSPYGDRK